MGLGSRPPKSNDYQGLGADCLHWRHVTPGYSNDYADLGRVVSSIMTGYQVTLLAKCLKRRDSDLARALQYSPSCRAETDQEFRHVVMGDSLADGATDGCRSRL